jgi:hypothetical protein
MEPDKLDGKAKLLMIYIDENDWWQREPLHEAIVKKLRMLDLAGATVYRGILGYGEKNRLHKSGFLGLKDDQRDRKLKTIFVDDRLQRPGLPFVGQRNWPIRTQPAGKPNSEASGGTD